MKYNKIKYFKILTYNLIDKQEFFFKLKEIIHISCFL